MCEWNILVQWVHQKLCQLLIVRYIATALLEPSSRNLPLDQKIDICIYSLGKWWRERSVRFAPTTNTSTVTWDILLKFRFVYFAMSSKCGMKYGFIYGNVHLNLYFDLLDLSLEVLTGLASGLEVSGLASCFFSTYASLFRIVRCPRCQRFSVPLRVVESGFTLAACKRM